MLTAKNTYFWHKCFEQLLVVQMKPDWTLKLVSVGDFCKEEKNEGAPLYTLYDMQSSEKKEVNHSKRKSEGFTLCGVTKGQQ